jgi:hypothetical protein
MGAMIITYLLLGGFILLAVSQFGSSIRALGVIAPTWVFIVLAALVLLAFILVPKDSQALITVFRAAER